MRVVELEPDFFVYTGAMNFSFTNVVTQLYPPIERALQVIKCECGAMLTRERIDSVAENKRLDEISKAGEITLRTIEKVLGDLLNSTESTYVTCAMLRDSLLERLPQLVNDQRLLTGYEEFLRRDPAELISHRRH